MSKKSINDTKIKVCFGLNIAIFVFAFLAFAFLIAKLNPTDVFPNFGVSYLRSFAFIVNILEAIFAIIMIVYTNLYRKKKITEIPHWVYLVNMGLTVLLILNCFVSLLYLAPVCAVIGVYSVEWIFTGTNMIFHIIIPCLVLTQFIFALPNTNIKFKEILYPLGFVGIYAIAYLICGLTHLNPNGSVNLEYDWYAFAHTSAYFYFLAVPAILGVTYAISYLVWYGNKTAVVTKNIIDITLNIVILFMSVVAITWLFYIPIVNPDKGLSQAASVAKRFYYFTNWSLFLIFIASIVHLVYLFRLQFNKIKQIPNWVNCFKLSAVGLSSLVLFFELLIIFPINHFSNGIDQAWRICFGHHLKFSHLLIPMFSLMTYIVVENNSLKRKWCLLAASPIGLYCLIYMINLYAHYGQEWSKDVLWDVYSILKYLNYKVVWLAPILLYGFSFFITWLIWLGSHKIYINVNNIQIEKKQNIKQIKK